MHILHIFLALSALLSTPETPPGCIVEEDIQNEIGVVQVGGFSPVSPVLCGVAIQTGDGVWLVNTEDDIAINNGSASIVMKHWGATEAFDAYAPLDNMIYRIITWIPAPQRTTSELHKTFAPFAMRDWGVCIQGCVSPPWP